MHQKNIYNFIEWTKLKIRLHLKPINKSLYFKEREIWWASLGINIGFETDGKNEKFERPVLIIKVFNGEVIWILPLTSKEKIGKYYYPFKFAGRKSTAILSQLRLISSKRLLRKIGKLPENDFKPILQRVKNLL